MKTIVVNSQKGGSGKTTICRVLSVAAVENHRQNFPKEERPVYLIDTDTQRSLTQWHEAREAEEPRRVELLAGGLRSTLTTLGQSGASYAFVDTPPQASEHMDDVFRLADLVLVPIKPTPDDLKSAAVTVNRLKGLGVPYLFVITQAIQNTNITAQAIAALSHHGPVAQTMIVNRVIYPAAFTDGRTPLEIEQKGAAAKETLKLWAGIETYLHEILNSERKVVNG